MSTPSITHDHHISTDEGVEAWHLDSSGRQFGHQEHMAVIKRRADAKGDADHPDVALATNEHTHENVVANYDVAADITTLDFGSPEARAARWEGSNDRRSGSDRRGTNQPETHDRTSTTDGSQVTKLPTGAAASNVATDSLVDNKEAPK